MLPVQAQYGIQYLFHDKDTAVTVNLDRILRRVGSGSTHHTDQHLIDQLLIPVTDIPVVNRVARNIRKMLLSTR